MSIKKKNIFLTFIFCILFFFSFVSDYSNSFGSYISYLRIIAEAAGLAYGCLLIGKEKLHDGFIFLVMLMHVILVIACIVNGTTFVPFIKRGLHIVSLCILVKGGCKNNSIILLKSLIYTFVFYGIINLCYRIPNVELDNVYGTGSIYFLGSDNEAASPMLVLLTLSVLYWCIVGKNRLSIIGLIIPFFTMFYSKCGTGMMVLFLFSLASVMFFIPYVRASLKKLCSSKAVMMLLVLYYIVLAWICSGKLGFLSIVINKLTGKNSITFTNRDVIWLKSIDIIKNNFWFGIGYGDGAGGNGVFVNGFFRGSHNMILQWGVNGGVFVVSIFLIILVLVFKRIEKNKYPTSFFLFLCCFIYLIAMSMENYSNGLHFFPLLAVIYYFNLEHPLELKAILA